MADDYSLASGASGDSGSDSSSSDSSSGSSSSRWKKAVQSGGRSLNASSNAALDSVRQEAASAASNMPSYRKGGRVRKTGPAVVHRGELVVPRGKVKRVQKALRASKRTKKGRSSGGR